MWQPYASLIAVGAKSIETRSWPAPYVGGLAIHASKRLPPDTVERCCREPYRSALFGELSGEPLLEAIGRLPRGAIVAVAEVGEVHLIGDTICAGDLDWREREFGDYTPGRYAWCLWSVRQLPEPIPCRGALGLWDVPAEIAAAIARQAEVTA